MKSLAGDSRHIYKGIKEELNTLLYTCRDSSETPFILHLVLAILDPLEFFGSTTSNPNLLPPRSLRSPRQRTTFIPTNSLPSTLNSL